MRYPNIAKLTIQVGNMEGYDEFTKLKPEEVIIHFECTNPGEEYVPPIYKDDWQGYSMSKLNFYAGLVVEFGWHYLRKWVGKVQTSSLSVFIDYLVEENVKAIEEARLKAEAAAEAARKAAEEKVKESEQKEA